VKLKYLDRQNQTRRDIAQQYLEPIDHPDVTLPAVHDFSENAPGSNGGTPVDPTATPVTAVDSHVWHLFVVRHPDRDALRQYLEDEGVDTLIHYPIPPHEQEAYSEWEDQSLPITERIHEEVLSLPMGPHLSEEDAATVSKLLNEYPHT